MDCLKARYFSGPFFVDGEMGVFLTAIYSLVTNPQGLLSPLPPLLRGVKNNTRATARMQWVR